MKKGILATVLTLIITLAVLPASAEASVSASPELYRSSLFVLQNSCFAIKADNSLWGWGYNVPHQGGRIVPGSKQEYFLKPVKVADNVLSVGNNGSCTLILKTNGDLLGWGYYDGLGLGKEIGNASKPIKVMEGVIDFKTTYGFESNYTVALKKDGTLWHWGKKWSQDYWNSLTPSLLLENVAALCNTEYAIKKDGTMWELTPTSRTGTALRPQKIELTQDANDAKILYSNAYIKSDGSLWLWGSNEFGQVTEVGAGRGMFTEDVPMENAKKKLDDVVFFNKSFAIKKDGSLWAWGSNQYGMMGKGDDSGEFYTTSGWSVGGEGFKGIPYYTNPVKVMEDVVFCDAGGSNVLAVKKDGSLWSWGDAYNGKVGNGSLRTGVEKEALGQKFYPTPQKIMTGVRVTNATVYLPPPKYSAAPASSTVFVNGRKVSFGAYNINGNNYFKLRDLAYALNGTEKQFAVDWDAVKNAISLTTGVAYAGPGRESIRNAGGATTAIPSSSKILIDGKEIQIMAYTINNSNYFKLRDIGEAIGFSVSFDSAQNSILIDTAGSH